MPTPLAERPLRELERLSHDQRMRRMVEVGREAATDPRAAQVMAELESGGTYERLLAVHACYGRSGGKQDPDSGSHVLRALRDPSRLIRKRAVRLAPLVCTDDQVQEALADAAPAVRQPLVRALAMRRRR